MLPSALLAAFVLASAEAPGAVAPASAPPAAANPSTAAVAATSATAPGASMPTLAPAWLDLYVNAQPRGTVLVQLGDGDAWIAAEDLEQAGVRVSPAGERIERAGRSLVSLRSLAPGISFQVDEVALAVRIVASEPLLGHSTLDLLRTTRPPGLLHRQASSAYLNLGVSGDTEDRRAGAGELAIALGRGLLVSGATADRVNGVVRGLTTGSWEDREHLQRWSAGDVLVSPTDPLAGTAVVLGGAVGRDFGLDPYLQKSEYPRTSVFSATPATLEVWVDDALVRRTQVQPGTVDIENIPINVGGLSQIRTVLRDPFGREVSASTYALLGSSTLAPGLVDWGVTAGARRLAYGTRSFDYGPALGAARVRAGITPVLTLGGRLEAGERLVSAGPSVSLATRLAEVDASAAASYSDSSWGAAGYVALRRAVHRAGVVAQLRWDSGRYANGSLSPAGDRARVRGSIAGSLALTPRLTVVGELAAERYRDAGRDGRGVVRLTYGLPGGLLTTLSAGRSVRESAPDSTDVLLSISVVLGRQTTAELQGATGTRGAAEYGQASVNRQLLAGTDVGYRVVARGGDGAVSEAELRGQDQWVRGEVFHQERDPWSGTRTPYSSAQLASALAFIDGRVFLTRPVEGAYAVVKVEDAPGVHVLLQGQDVGRTDRNGELFVTGLMPYFGNRISIRDSDLPLEYRVDEVERTIAPRQRGGSIERFRIARQLAVTGRIVLDLDGKDFPPEFGEVAVEVPGRRAASPIGDGGAFWLEGIPPGAHDALVKWEGKLCRFTFEVPKDSAGVLDLGRVRCVQML